MPATPAWPPRSLTRLFVDTPLGAGTMVEVEGGQANYLANVMRMKAGDQLLLFDGASGEWLAEIGDAGRKRALDKFTWRQTAVGTVAHYRALLDEQGPSGRR